MKELKNNDILSVQTDGKDFFVAVVENKETHELEIWKYFMGFPSPNHKIDYNDFVKDYKFRKTGTRKVAKTGEWTNGG